MVVGEKSVADEIISLDVRNEPLVEVLEDISIAVNCQFNIDESWQDYPVTAAFYNEPLHRGLKKIFRNVNNAVIYNADRTIKIIIYGEVTSFGRDIGHSATTNPSQESLHQSQPFSDATASQPEVEDSEDSGGDGEDDETEPEPTVETASEPNEVRAENVEATEAGLIEAAEAKTDVLEPATNEDVP
ncbi:MAG: hypothetical protein PVF14_16650 [Desulfobacterales bacterium]|jgi:hypothetical protein